MNSERPPLTPPDCDLRDFPFMQLEIKRLLGSETWILGTGDERAAAIALWLESWHQVPAASLPDNDRMLVHLSQSKAWKRVKEHALRGWVKCSDGRLYHPVVAEKSLEAWIEKLLNRLSGSTGNAKRWGIEVDINAISRRVVEAAALLRSIAPQSKSLKKKQVVSIVSGSLPDGNRIPIRQDKTSPPDSGPDSSGDRKREGERKREIKNKSYSGGVGSLNVVGPVDNSEAPPLLSADEIGKHLVQLEAERDKALRLPARVSEDLLKIAKRGITLPVLLHAHGLACARRAQQGDDSPVNPGFLAAFVDEALAEHRGAGRPSGKSWDETTEGVLAKAEELGIPPRQGSEDWIWFRRRVIKASGDQRLIERAVSEAERMNLNEYELVHRYLYGVLPGQAAA
ncbi:DUF1376 domain-containing protein [Cupriavidus sp. D39]|uniref:DUF1376 domain-containing protein n=1 Tax=Cupriavidus sp. D39 TaxID=2997877 RepID=UPI00227067BB|nr:DUF1376 domain-containing protein [Cupriavidus sp. D39]MCY0856883.1 DUF1376 domain-containing protein [Cupriavidus sp. D39]